MPHEAIRETYEDAGRAANDGVRRGEVVARRAMLVPRYTECY